MKKLAIALLLLSAPCYAQGKLSGDLNNRVVEACKQKQAEMQDLEKEISSANPWAHLMFECGVYETAPLDRQNRSFQVPLTSSEIARMDVLRKASHDAYVNENRYAQRAIEKRGYLYAFHEPRINDVCRITAMIRMDDNYITVDRYASFGETESECRQRWSKIPSEVK